MFFPSALLLQVITAFFLFFYTTLLLHMLEVSDGEYISFGCLSVLVLVTIIKMMHNTETELPLL